MKATINIMTIAGAEIEVDLEYPTLEELKSTLRFHTQKGLVLEQDLSGINCGAIATYDIIVTEPEKPVENLNQ